MNKKSKFATAQMILYYIVLVVCILSCIANALSINNSSVILEGLITFLIIVLVVLLIGIMVFAIADIIYAVKMYKNRELSVLYDGMKKIKLVTIPCYIVNYIVCAFWCLFLLCTIVASVGGIVLAVVFTFATCLVIAATGAYGIALIKLFNELYPENQISKVHYVLQLLACLDVVSSVILLCKYKKQVKDC